MTTDADVWALVDAINAARDDDHWSPDEIARLEAKARELDIVPELWS